MIRIGLAIILLGLAQDILAQVLKGQLFNTTGEPIIGASILVRKTDSTKILAYALSNAKGQFQVSYSTSEKTMIEIRHLEYESKVIILDSALKDFDTLLIVLQNKVQSMREVVIERKLPVTIKNDTIVFNADSYSGPEVIKVEDLLGRLQGFSVNPDGRLSFNGRPVEKLLIDGEDLVGKAYQLVTKNLSALYIDKVEVINDYSDNRLMRRIQKSGSVGVNLKIKKKYNNKINANAELACSAEGRYHAEGNGFRIGSKLKMFGFFNANNSAQDVLGNAASYYEMEGSKESNEITNAENILSVGRISIPAVNERYKDDNKDMSLATMAAGKMGKYTKWKSLVVYSEKQLQYAANSEVETFIDSNSQWKIANQMKEFIEGNSALIKLAATSDNGQARVLEYFLDAGIANSNKRFSNNAQYDKTDSLKEKLSGRKISVQTGWKLTIQNRKKSLMVWESTLRWMAGLETLSSVSGRYAPYFGLDDSYILNGQELKTTDRRFSTSLTWLKNFKRWNYRFGLELRINSVEMSGITVLSNQISDSNYSGARETAVESVNGFFKTGYKLSSRSELGCSMAGGPQWMSRIAKVEGNPAYDLGINYVYRWSNIRTFRAGLKSVSRAVSPWLDIPAPLISGNAAILGGLFYQTPESENSFQASYQVFHVQKQQNWSISLNINSSKGRYQNSVIAEPAYTLNYHELTRGNHSGFLVWRIEKYLNLVKGKTGFGLAISDILNRFTLNNMPESGRNRSLQSEVWWVSGFKEGPGFETRIRGGLVSSGKDDLWETFWNMGWNQKIHWRINKNSFVSLIWSAAQLGVKKYFHGLDFFFQRKLGQNARVYLRGNNLLNVKNIGEKMVQPYTVSYTNYSLVGRYILVGFNIQW